MRRPRPGQVWGGLLAVGLAYEAYGLCGGREGYTLSEVTRAVFRVEHPVGKCVFLSLYLGFSAWFLPHIVLKASDAIREVMAEQ